MGKQQFANNLLVTLDAAVNASVTTFNVITGDGAKLPAIAAGEFLKMTLAFGFPSAETAWEVIRVTSVTGDALTVVRAQDGTSGKTWPEGQAIEARLTEVTMESWLQKNGDVLEAFSEIEVAPTVAGTTDIDAAIGNAHFVDLDQNTTLSFSNIPATGVVALTVIIEQDATGSFTVGLPAEVTRGTLDLALTALFQTIAVFVTRDGGTNFTVMTSFKEE